MISSISFSYYFTVITIWDTHQKFKTSELLLDEEFIIIKRVKLLFH